MRALSLVFVLAASAGLATSTLASTAEEARPTPGSGDTRAAQEGSAARAVVGQPAPDFTLQDHEGRTHRLADYRGKIVVLEWTNPECPFVVRHYNARTMQRLAQTLAGDDFVWLSINSTHHNRVEQTLESIQTYGLPFPVLQDQSGDVGRLYGARTTPHMYVIDAQGVLRYAGAIDDDPRGRSENPDNYVQRAVAALRAAQPVDPSSTQAYGCTVKYEGVR